MARGRGIRAGGRLLTGLLVAGLLAACAGRPGPDCDAELLVSEYGANRIDRFDGCSGAALGAVADPDGLLAGPQTIRPGPDGLLYVASERNDRIVRVDPAAMRVVDVWLDSPRLAHPTAIDFGADGAAYIGSFDGDRVLRYADGRLEDWFVGGDVDGVDAGMSFGPDGNLWIPSFDGDVLLVVDPDSRAVLRRIRGLAAPRMLLWAPDGRSVLIGVWRADRIDRLDLDAPGALPTGWLARLRPSGLAWMPDGTLLTISDVRPPVLRVDADVDPPAATRFAGDDDLQGLTYLLRLSRSAR